MVNISKKRPRAFQLHLGSRTFPFELADSCVDVVLPYIFPDRERERGREGGREGERERERERQIEGHFCNVK